MVTVEVITPFVDMESSSVFRVAGDRYECDEKRAKYLADKKFVKYEQKAKRTSKKTE